MDQQVYDEIRRQLLDKGYSRKYTKRLLDELHDHANCLAPGSSELQSSTRYDARLGLPNEIVQAVICYPELSPLIRRYPWAAFAVIPACFLCAFGALMAIFAGQSTHMSFVSYPDWVGQSVALSIRLIEFGLPIVLAMTACIVASRYRLNQKFPLISTLLMCILSMFQMDIRYCTVSCTVFAVYRQDFDILNFLALLTILSCCVLSSMLSGRSMTNSTINKSNSVLTRNILELVAILGFLIAVTMGLQVAVGASTDQFRPHSYDNIIKQKSNSDYASSIIIGLFRNTAIKSELGLSETDVLVLDQAIEMYDAESKRIRTQISIENKNDRFLPMSDERLGELRLKTHELICGRLNQSQTKRLEQLMLQAFGKDFVFLNPYNRQLRLSIVQIKKLKDISLRSTKINSKYIRSYQKASGQDRQRIRHELTASLETIDAEFIGVLTPAQQRIYDSLLGISAN